MTAGNQWESSEAPVWTPHRILSVILSELRELKTGTPYRYISGQGTATLDGVEDHNERLLVRRNQEAAVGIPFAHVAEIAAGLSTGGPVHVDSILHAGGNLRTVLETLLVQLPHVAWTRVDGKKMLIWSPDELHELAKPLERSASGLAGRARFSKIDLDVSSVADSLYMDEALIHELVSALLTHSPQVVLAGPPGTSKTLVAEAVARLVTGDDKNLWRLVQLHPSYGYEEFVQGLAPSVEAGAVVFGVQDGVVVRMAKAIRALQESNPHVGPHVIVMDEMNRANLPRVLGELMYLFEYREHEIDLQYSTDFSLPQEMKFIGTMNTADRSIRSIDVALRRRFEVFELFPDVDVLRRFYERGGGENLVGEKLYGGFTALNVALERHLDRHHTIGHAFFMADIMNEERLCQVWTRRVGPLISEYFFDREDDLGEFEISAFWDGLVCG